MYTSSSAGPEAFGFVVILGVICVGLLIALGIQAFICYLLSDALKRLPPEFRKQQPNMVWLLMIPLFSLVWNFFVYPKISESYQAYFSAKAGNIPNGSPNLNYQNTLLQQDTGQGIGLAYCICCCCSIIPYLGACIGLAALVLLIIYLVKLSGLKARVTPFTSNPSSGNFPVQ